jgi:DNA-binding NtrC family response regulator
MDDFKSLIEAINTTEFSAIKLPVLIVDDSKATRNVIDRMLRSAGIVNVIEACSAQEAFSVLSTENISIALIDIELGEVSGVQLLRAIRNIPRLRMTPFVIMTASRTHRHIVDAKHLGASGYLLKPFKLDNLLDKLRPALGTRKTKDGSIKEGRQTSANDRLPSSWGRPR